MKHVGTGMVCLAGLLIWCGCGGDENATAPASPTTAPVAVASPGAAPTYGEPSGMGFSTGDAGHGDAAGGGSTSFHAGAMGTSSAITDEHPVSKPSFPTTDPVLPPP